MFEQLMIMHCAPTLAGIKAANLFSLTCAGVCERCQLKRWDRRLKPFGIRVQALYCENHRVLVYVYRPKRLQQTLKHEKVAAFLQPFGYESGWNQGEALQYLRQRMLHENGFPHEIGVFLDYPLEDVQGFIINAGKACKYSGLWKVYGDIHRAKQLFASYQSCTERYLALFQSGATITQLANAM